MGFFQRFLPHPDTIRNHRYLRWMGPAIHAQDLWQLNRRSVAGGVAVGFFFAFILPVAQFVAVAIAAVLLRVNLPVALTSTLITNPFTFAPWYYLAYQIGGLLTDAPAENAPTPVTIPSTGSVFDGFGQGFDALMAMGQPLLIGLAVLAVVSATVGYLLVNVLWRGAALLRLRRRRALQRSPGERT
ncbi:DUF2062 domain-containing protein [Accumulibacter sp.]|uniref:DUF2062 domain-containing protein n=1 Tax=Accumulibacter sp. TaxID=2053492 RepID=UPI0028C4A6AD|nr:DUF2062 domain-containing protein [Accumulibacter sp.]